MFLFILKTKDGQGEGGVEIVTRVGRVEARLSGWPAGWLVWPESVGWAGSGPG